MSNRGDFRKGQRTLQSTTTSKIDIRILRTPSLALHASSLLRQITKNNTKLRIHAASSAHKTLSTKRNNRHIYTKGSLSSKDKTKGTKCQT